jgi:hypothetical protein
MKSPKTVLDLRKMSCSISRIIKDRLNNLIISKGEYIDYQNAYYLRIDGYHNDITHIILYPTEKKHTIGENAIFFIQKNGLTKELYEMHQHDDCLIDVIEFIENM